MPALEAALFPGFENFTVSTSQNISISGVRGGSGPPILLLHGFPQSKEIWHIIAPSLAKRFTVVAIDLRGYGSSSKPPGSPSHGEYAKSKMAKDGVVVMNQLGYEKFFLCGHDRGARVAHKLCVDHPQAVIKVMLLDICPTLEMYKRTEFNFAKTYFHWFFLIQEAPFPEDVIMADPAGFGKRFMHKRFDGFDARAMNTYMDAFKKRETVHAMCEDYRAGASIDMEETENDMKDGKRIQCQIRVLWGKKGIIGRLYDPINLWKKYSALGEVDGHELECGHYIPEERPAELLEEMLEYFS